VAIAFTIIAILLIGAIVGTTLNIVALFVAIPLALIFIGAVIGKEGMDRQRRIMQMKRFRRSARARKTDFTPVDKRTLI
jgi:uncharacterized integral membrane protein